MSEPAVRFEVTTEYNLGAYYVIARAQTNLTQKRLRIGYLATGFLFAAAFLYVLVISITDIFASIAWLIAFGLLAFVILSTGLRLDRTVAKKLWKKNHKYVSNVTYQFYADHMTADNPKDMRLNYSDIHAIREAGKFILIYASENAVSVIFKDGFKKGNVDAFRTFITKKTGKQIEEFH